MLSMLGWLRGPAAAAPAAALAAEPAVAARQPEEDEEDEDEEEYDADERAAAAKRKRGRAGAGARAPALEVRADAPYGEVAAAFVRFLLTDARVPSEARRVAAGLAPYASSRRAHYGLAGGGMFAPRDPAAPYDAAAILKQSRATPWANAADGAVVAARVNASQTLFNTLFTDPRADAAVDGRA